MVNAAGDGGGGGAVIHRLEPLFAEIADLLGQLAGNEITRVLLEAEANKPLEYPWTRVQSTFTIPGDYSFSLDMPLVTLQPASEEGMTSPVSDEDRRRELQALIDSTWEKTRTHWSASDIPSQYRSISQQVWEPVTSPMAQGAESLGELTRWLGDQLQAEAGWVTGSDPAAPDWLRNLTHHWPATSQGAQSFQAFWNDVNEKCGLYLHVAARLATTAAQVTTTISDFQLNLYEATEKARDQCKVALQQWQAWKSDSGSWPTGEMQDNPDLALLGHASYATGVASLYGPQAVVTGPLSVLFGTLTYVLPKKVHVMKAATAATADDIHAGFLEDLATIHENLQGTFDKLRTLAPKDESSLGAIGFADVVADAQANHRDWKAPAVNL